MLSNTMSSETTTFQPAKRDAGEAPRRLIAAHDVRLLQRFEHIAGVGGQRLRARARGRPSPELPFDARVIDAERSVGEERQSDDDEDDRGGARLPGTQGRRGPETAAARPA